MRFDELEFKAEAVRDDGRVTLRLTGELDLDTVGVLEAALPAMEPGQRLVLDLRELQFIDSTAIHVLMRLDVASRAEGWELAIVRGRAAVQKVLDLCHVGTRIRIVDAPEEA